VDVGDIGVGGGAPGQSEVIGAEVSVSEEEEEEEEEASSSQESGAVETGALQVLRGVWEVERVRKDRDESSSCRLRFATLMVEVEWLSPQLYDAGVLRERSIVYRQC